MISYDGTIYFGLAGDRDVVPDLDDLVGALREALREQPVPRRPAKRRAAAPKEEGCGQAEGEECARKGEGEDGDVQGEGKEG